MSFPEGADNYFMGLHDTIMECHPWNIVAIWLFLDTSGCDLWMLLLYLEDLHSIPRTLWGLPLLPLWTLSERCDVVHWPPCILPRAEAWIMSTACWGIVSQSDWGRTSCSPSKMLIHFLPRARKWYRLCGAFYWRKILGRSYLSRMVLSLIPPFLVSLIIVSTVE